MRLEAGHILCRLTASTVEQSFTLTFTSLCDLELIVGLICMSSVSVRKPASSKETPTLKPITLWLAV